MKALLICRAAEGVDPTVQFAPYLADERAALLALSNSGTLLEAYTPGGPGAVLILNVARLADAETIAAELPLRAANLITVEVVALTPMPLTDS